MREDPKTGALTPQTPIPVVTPKPGTTPVTTPASRGTKSGLATAAVCPVVCDFPQKLVLACVHGMHVTGTARARVRGAFQSAFWHSTRPLCTAFQASHNAEQAEGSEDRPAGCRHN